MASLSLFTNWTVGAMNGYKENGLPNNIKYSTMAMAAFIHTIKAMPVGKPNLITLASITGVIIGTSLKIGINFCVGHHLGKAIRLVEDDTIKNKNRTKIEFV